MSYTARSTYISNGKSESWKPGRKELKIYMPSSKLKPGKAFHPVRKYPISCSNGERDNLHSMTQPNEEVTVSMLNGKQKVSEKPYVTTPINNLNSQSSPKNANSSKKSELFNENNIQRSSPEKLIPENPNYNRRLKIRSTFGKIERIFTKTEDSESTNLTPIKDKKLYKNSSGNTADIDELEFNLPELNKIFLSQESEEGHMIRQGSTGKRSPRKLKLNELERIYKRSTSTERHKHLEINRYADILIHQMQSPVIKKLFIPHTQRNYIYQEIPHSVPRKLCYENTKSIISNDTDKFKRNIFQEKKEISNLNSTKTNISSITFRKTKPRFTKKLHEEMIPLYIEQSIIRSPQFPINRQYPGLVKRFHKHADYEVGINHKKNIFHSRNMSQPSVTLHKNQDQINIFVNYQQQSSQ